MHIVNEKDLNVLWGWDDQEEQGLTTRYQANLERLLEVLRARVESPNAPESEDLTALAMELQEAADRLSECAENCFEAARYMYALAADDTAERAKRREAFDALLEHVGGKVVLKQSSVPQIAGKQLTLDDIRGIRGILSDGENLWEALVDFLVPVYESSGE